MMNTFFIVTETTLNHDTESAEKHICLLKDITEANPGTSEGAMAILRGDDSALREFDKNYNFYSLRQRYCQESKFQFIMMNAEDSITLEALDLIMNERPLELISLFLEHGMLV